jgi:hypothetical protein
VVTWAGKFIADSYDAEYRVLANSTVGYAADIHITFEPNSLVDAEDISDSGDRCADRRLGTTDRDRGCRDRRG